MNRTRRLVLVLIVAVVFAAPVTPARAQAPGRELVQVSQGLPLTIPALSARLEAAKTAPSLSEQARSEVVQQYQQAIDSLTIAQANDAKADELNASATAAPQDLAQVRRKLAEPASEQLQPPDADASLDSLRQQLARQQLALDDARARAAHLDEALASGAARRSELPSKLGAARQELDKDTASSAAQALSDNRDELQLASAAAHLAARQALLARIRSLEAEMRSYDARVDLVPAQRELALREGAALEDAVRGLQKLVERKRSEEAQAAAKHFAEAQQRIVDQYPELAELAAQTAALAQRRTNADGVATEADTAKKALQAAQARIEELVQRQRSVREKATAVGFTPFIGLLLQHERKDLPDVDRLDRSIGARREQIGKVQLELLELDEARAKLADLDQAVKQTIGHLAVSTPDQAKALRDPVRKLLSAQRDAIDSLIGDYNDYFVTLVDLDAAQQRLVEGTKSYKRFIDEHILWVRSGNALTWERVTEAGRAIAWLVAPDNLRQLGSSLSTVAVTQPLLVAACALMLALLLGYRARLRGQIEALRAGDKQRIDPTLRATAIVVFSTAVIALPGPFLVYVVSWALSGIEANRFEYTRAISSGLMRITPAYFTVEFLRQLCRENGLGKRFFGWPDRSVAVARKLIRSAMLVALPAFFVLWVLIEQDDPERRLALGIVVFVGLMIGIVVIVRRLFDVEHGILVGVKTKSPWLDRLRPALPNLLAAPAIGLALLAIFGYPSAAARLAGAVMETIWIGTVLWIVHGIARRWLLSARRRLAVSHARARAEAQRLSRAKGQSDAVADGDVVQVEEPKVDLATIDAQTRRLLSGFIWISLAVCVWMIWEEVLPAFGVFDRFVIWSTTGADGSQTAVTFGSLLKAGLIVAVTIGASRNIPGVLEITVLRRLPFEPGLRYAVRAVSQYLIVLVGLLACAGTLGLAWSQVQWLAAAVTVGLGFGLQEIFGNFVSGLIILFERPVRVGDTVTLGDVQGTVSKIRIRATTIVDWDRRELIVPNKEFITGQLINWTLSDPILRIVVPVGIAYGSDTALAEKLLLEVASKCELVLADPPPTVLFSSFGDSSLDFQLRVFIPSIDVYWRAKHALHMAIDQEFRKAGVEIAFPQRDLHLRSVEEPLPVFVRKSE